MIGSNFLARFRLCLLWPKHFRSRFPVFKLPAQFCTSDSKIRTMVQQLKEDLFRFLGLLVCGGKIRHRVYVLLLWEKGNHFFDILSLKRQPTKQQSVIHHSQRPNICLAWSLSYILKKLWCHVWQSILWLLLKDINFNYVVELTQLKRFLLIFALKLEDVIRLELTMSEIRFL